MEKCAKLVVDGSGKIVNMIGEISCNPETITITQYPNWFVWGGISVIVVIVLIIAWSIVIEPIWKVWAQGKQGEADLAQAHREQQVQVARAQGRMDAAKINKDAAVIEAEAVAKQIETIGTNLKEHDLYLKWQWTKMMEERPNNSVIYVPTEANMPILEAGKRREN